MSDDTQMSLAHKIARAAGFGLAGTVATAAAVGAWTQVERRWPTLREYTAYIDLPSTCDELTVLHVSDPHFFRGQEWLVDFMKDLATLDFDLVVSTGDNLGSKAGLELALNAYDPLLAHPGIFVLGSNDYYSPRYKPWWSYLSRHGSPGHQRNIPDLPWLALVERFTEAGWIDLSNQVEVCEIPTACGPQRIGCIGVDDPHIKRDHVPEPPDNWGDPNILRLGVTHAPYQRVLNDFVSLGVNAIFAGHTHGGQLRVPGYGAIVTNCDIPREYASGLHTWGFGGLSAALHVSAGLGTSPFAPVRFACRPEASLITLKQQP
ncbi:MAG: metallophosphoesterase [Actinomycetaceae bacterium]|nr:metallophosphoesterase [Actinomycetaceae bacterium]